MAIVSSVTSLTFTVWLKEGHTQAEADQFLWDTLKYVAYTTQRLNPVDNPSPTLAECKSAVQLYLDHLLVDMGRDYKSNQDGKAAHDSTLSAIDDMLGTFIP
jgi:hypothetical protein